MKNYTDSRGTEHKIIEHSLPTGNATDGGWVLINMNGEDSYEMFVWEPNAGEGDEDYGKYYTTYSLGDPDDVSDWVDVEKVGETIDMDGDELLSMMKSKDVKKRAWAYEAVAMYYGWGELSAGYSEQEDVFQLISQFGDEFDEPTVEVDYEELATESGLRISGPDYQGWFDVVEWGWVGPQGPDDGDDEIQRVEYSVNLDDMFKGRPGELENLLMASPEEQESIVVEAVQRVISNSRATRGDIEMVTNIGDD
jgi:hypothetical protein